MVLTLEHALESPRRLLQTDCRLTPRLLTQEVWEGPSTRSSNRIPGGADAAGLETTFVRTSELEH